MSRMDKGHGPLTLRWCCMSGLLDVTLLVRFSSERGGTSYFLNTRPLELPLVERPKGLDCLAVFSNIRARREATGLVAEARAGLGDLEESRADIREDGMEVISTASFRRFAPSLSSSSLLPISHFSLASETTFSSSATRLNVSGRP